MKTFEFNHELYTHLKEEKEIKVTTRKQDRERLHVCEATGKQVWKPVTVITSTFQLKGDTNVYTDKEQVMRAYQNREDKKEYDIRYIEDLSAKYESKPSKILNGKGKKFSRTITEQLNDVEAFIRKAKEFQVYDLINCSKLEGMYNGVYMACKINDYAKSEDYGKMMKEYIYMQPILSEAIKWQRTDDMYTYRDLDSDTNYETYRHSTMNSYETKSRISGGIKAGSPYAENNWERLSKAEQEILKWELENDTNMWQYRDFLMEEGTFSQALLADKYGEA